MSLTKRIAFLASAMVLMGLWLTWAFPNTFSSFVKAPSVNHPHFFAGAAYASLENTPLPGTDDLQTLSREGVVTIVGGVDENCKYFLTSPAGDTAVTSHAGHKMLNPHVVVITGLWVNLLDYSLAEGESLEWTLMDRAETINANPVASNVKCTIDATLDSDGTGTMVPGGGGSLTSCRKRFRRFDGSHYCEKDRWMVSRVCCVSETGDCPTANINALVQYTFDLHPEGSLTPTPLS